MRNLGEMCYTNSHLKGERPMDQHRASGITYLKGDTVTEYSTYATEKRCVHCKRVLPADKFYKRPALKDGLHSWCIECMRASERKRKGQTPRLKIQVENDRKICTKCGKSLPFTEFYKQLGGTLDLMAKCKECTKSAEKQHRDSNIEKMRARGRRYYHKHSDKRKAYLRQHYRNNKESYAKRARIDYLKDRQDYINRSNKRRVVERNQGKGISQTEWDYCLAYWEHCCAVCGKRADLWTVIAQDHWVPLSKGGPNTPQNIIPLCHSRKGAPAGQIGCNSSKGNTLPIDWLIDRFGKRKAQQIIKRVNQYFEHIETRDQDV